MDALVVSDATACARYSVEERKPRRSVVDREEKGLAGGGRDGSYSGVKETARPCGVDSCL
jgi:hypothetical protein